MAVGAGPARVSTTRRVVSLWYFVVVIASLGVLAPIPFVHAALRLRRAVLWVFVVLYGVLAATLFSLVGFIEAKDEKAEAIIAVSWFVGTIVVIAAACIHLARLRRRILYPPLTSWVENGMHCGLFSIDIAGFGQVGRTSETFVQVRHVLFSLLANAFEVSGVTWEMCLRRDTGDGMIVVVPPHFPKVRLLYPLIAHLSSELVRYNASAPPALRIRVRVAIHAGEIRLDEYGVTGRPKVLLARLLDSRVLRDALTEAPDEVPMVILVSDRFHEDIQDQGEPGLDILSYQPVTVQEKETDVRAWLHIPDPVVKGWQ